MLPPPYNLREFVFANERHPESVRVFPWLRPAAGDSVPRGSAGIIGSVSGESFFAEITNKKTTFNSPANHSQMQDYNIKNGLWRGAESILQK